LPDVSIQKAVNLLKTTVEKGFSRK